MGSEDTRFVRAAVSARWRRSASQAGDAERRRRRRRAAAVSVLRLLEGHLQDAVAELVAVERRDGGQSLIVVGHRHEAEALALLRRKVAHHLDVLHGAERAEELPEDVLLRLRRQVVDEEAPTAAVEHVAGDEAVRQRQGTVHRRVPEDKQSRSSRR